MNIIDINISIIFEIITLILIITAFLCLYRAIIGPNAWDRLIAINVIGTKTIIILVLIGFIFDSLYFIDVAFVYALFNFILTIALSKYIEFGTL